MKESIFPQNGICYRTNDFEQNRETLIFIHGLSGSSSAWLKYEEKFGKTYNILTLDLRGHGKSRKYKKYQDYEINNFVRDVSELVDFLRIENFVLISHSFGTIIALELLRHYEAKISSMLFLSPIFDVKKVPQAFVARPCASIFTYLLRPLPFSPKIGVHIDYSKLGYTADFDPRRIYADIRNTTLRIYMYCLKQIYAFDNHEYVSEINIRTLIIHGKRDAFMPVKNSIADSKKITHCELVLIKDGNHTLPLNNFAEVSEAIENFLGEN